MKLSTRIISITMAGILALGCTGAVSAAQSEDKDFSIKIVHTNDIHARVQENVKSGIIGMPRLGGIIDSYTSGADMDLVLDSGDLYHGQPIASLVKGESVAELAKACGYDAMTAGNHDWSYGKDRLKELCDIADIDMLTGNVVTDSGESFFEKEFYTETVTVDGKELKVGVFGVIDPKIKSSTTPSNVAGLDFTDSVKYANTAAQELENQNCDIVIALAHTYHPDELASKVDGVDLWLAGHEHIDVDKTVTTPNGSQTRVIESDYYLYSASLIELSGDLDENGAAVNVKIDRTALDYSGASKYAPSDSVSAVMNKILSEQSVILEETVGESPEDLDGVWEHLRIGETKLGRAVADSYLLATGADVAFENAGGIRASVSKGKVTYGDILGVSPYGNYLVTKQVTGAQLKEIFEISLEIQAQCRVANDSGIYDAWPQSSGSYLQAGGVEIHYDTDKSQGSRIYEMKVGGKALDEQKLYTVATNNYAATSSYYPQLANAEESGEFCACEEALIKYFSQTPDAISKSINTPCLFEGKEPVEPETTSTTAPAETPTTEPKATSVAPTSPSVPTGQATGSTPTEPGGNGTVQTGTGGYTVLAVLLLLSFSAFVIVKRRKDIII